MKKYYLHNGTEQEGPFNFEELKTKEITRDTPIWFEGLSEWTTADKIQELKVLIVSTSPPIFNNRQNIPPSITTSKSTETTISIQIKQIINSKSKSGIAALICIIGFILPWIKVPIFGSVSGFEVINYGKQFDMTWINILYLIPIICVILIYDQFIKKILTSFIFNLLLLIPLLILIALLIILSSSGSQNSDDFIDINPLNYITIGFYITCIGALWQIANIDRRFIAAYFSDSPQIKHKLITVFKSARTPIILNLLVSTYYFYLAIPFLLSIDSNDFQHLDTENILSAFIIIICGIIPFICLLLLTVHEFHKPFLSRRHTYFLCFASLINPFLIIPIGVWLILTRKSIKLKLVNTNIEEVKLKSNIQLEKIIDEKPENKIILNPETTTLYTKGIRKPRISFQVKKIIFISIPVVAVATIVILCLTNIIQFNFLTKGKNEVSTQAEIITPDLCLYSASSALPEHKGKSYIVQNLFDKNIGTAWSEGVKGFGIDQYIELKFPYYKMQTYQSVELSGLQIINGYCKNMEAYIQNSSVKNLNIYHKGKIIKMATLTNRFSEKQIISIQPPIKLSAGDDIKIVIQDIYKGTKYTDVCISELIPILTLDEK